MVRDSNDIMAIVDPHGRLVYASPVTERILGLDIEPLIGSDVFDLIHPEDRARPLVAGSSPRATAERPTASRCGCAAATAAGASSKRCATNLLDDPSVEGIVISARDLTDRRRAEAELREAQERFRSAFEHAPIGMALISIDGRLFRVNRALVQILGRGESELLASIVARPQPPRRSRPVSRAGAPTASRAWRRARSSSSASCTTTDIRCGCR